MTDLAKLAAISALFLTIFTPATFAQERRELPESKVYGAPDCPDQPAEVTAFLDRYWSAWGEQDVDRLRALHADDAEWINAYARMFQTSDAMATFLEERLFPAFDPTVSRQEVENTRQVSLRYAGDEVAIAHFYTDSARGASQTAGEDLRRTHFHLVIERRNGVWQVVHTAIMDAR